MSNIFLAPMNQEDLEYDGFFDGQNLTIPDGTELNVVVIDGFVGIEEGKSQQVCMINISITSPGEFYGQKYRYNAKIYDMDANKRDLAMRNLGVIDAQAGFPMTNGQLALTTENIQDHWVGQAEARVKFGLLISTTDMQGHEMVDANGNPVVKEINFVRGFGYLREKMRKPMQAGQQQQHQQHQQAQQQVTQQPQQQAAPQYAQPQGQAQQSVDAGDPEIDF